MKNFKRFVHRGAIFAWEGPIITAIVWMCLKGAGVVSQLSVDEVVLGIVSTTIMAFVAAGISIVYQIEALPKAFAGLIQGAVLYIAFLAVYLMNGWVPIDSIWIFSLIFIGGFVIIWLSIYIPIKVKVNRMNKMLEK